MKFFPILQTLEIIGGDYSYFQGLSILCDITRYGIFLYPYCINYVSQRVHG